MTSTYVLTLVNDCNFYLAHHTHEDYHLTCQLAEHLYNSYHAEDGLTTVERLEAIVEAIKYMTEE